MKSNSVSPARRTVNDLTVKPSGEASGGWAEPSTELARIAQLVEQQFCNLKVVSSILTLSTIFNNTNT